jgi:dTDP-glucose pyrophosphorylase
MKLDNILNTDSTVKDVLKQMNISGVKTIFIVYKERLIGSVSDGDIRRAILSDISLEENVQIIMNNNPKIIFQDYNIDDVKEIFLNNRFEAIPVIDNNKRIIKIIFWNDLFKKDDIIYDQIVNVPVVIMAGGRGTRLEPFTKILPKPLIPIGEKTIIEHIIDEYKQYGIKDYYITVNYKANMIKAYFEDYSNDIQIHFVQENKPLGTAGSLKLVKDSINSSFFVSNCDIIIKTNYSDIFDFHKNGNYDLTLVASMQHYEIPYGICEIENGGNLIKITEKPEYDFLVNTGMYILEPNVLKYIPENDFFHITHLFEKLKSMNKRIGVYPVSKNSWIDIGQWDEYKKNLNILSI